MVRLLDEERRELLDHPVLTAAGAVVDVLGTMRDVREGEHAEHPLRGAQAALAHVTRATTLGELTASIAHEVNQPLLVLVALARRRAAELGT